VGDVVKLDSAPVDKVGWVTFIEGSDGGRYYGHFRENADFDAPDRHNREDTAVKVAGRVAGKGLGVGSWPMLAWGGGGFAELMSCRSDWQSSGRNGLVVEDGANGLVIKDGVSACRARARAGPGPRL